LGFRESTKITRRSSAMLRATSFFGTGVGNGLTSIWQLAVPSIVIA
jgi:hypothetical protein